MLEQKTISYQAGNSGLDDAIAHVMLQSDKLTEVVLTDSARGFEAYDRALENPKTYITYTIVDPNDGGLYNTILSYLPKLF